MTEIPPTDQELKRTCKLTGARWAAWVIPIQDRWVIHSHCSLRDPHNYSAVTGFLDEPGTKTILVNALESGRIQTSQKNLNGEEHGRESLFIFPGTPGCIIVCGEGFNEQYLEYWSILAQSTLDFPLSGSLAERGIAYVPRSTEYPLFQYGPPDETSRYPEQFALVSELALAVTTGTDTKEVAQIVIRKLGRIFRTDQVAVFLLSPDGRELVEYGENRVSRVNVPVASSLIGYVAEMGQTLRVGDISAAPRFLKEANPVRSALATPLKYRGRVIGVIGVESPEGDAFTNQDEQLLVVIASHLASLLENMRLLQQARQRVQNLEFIHRVVQRIVGLTNLEEIGQIVADLITEYLRYEVVIILLSDETGSFLESLAMAGKKVHEMGDSLRFPSTDGITGRVFIGGKSLLVNDVDQDPDYFTVGGFRAGSEISVPLWHGDQVVGVINIESESKYAFSNDELLMLESLAGVLASVIISARRYQASENMVRQLQAVRETALDISGDLELTKLLQGVIVRVRELVNAKGVEIGLLEQDQEYVKVMISDNPWYEDLDGIRPLGEGVTGQIALTGEPFHIADYNNWEDRLFPQERMPFYAVAGVPLKWRNEVLGTLVVLDDDQKRTFSDNDVRLLELLAPQVAAAIRNARLYQELERRMQAQQLAERQLLRSARLAALGEMAAGVAHELNNPLTTVYGFVELALEELPEDLPQREELELVASEALRAQKVVRRLLDFARLSDNRRMPSDLNALVENSISLMKHHAVASNVEIFSNYTSGLPLVNIDPGQIKQVLVNLTQNALLAMPMGGKLSFRTGLKVRQNQPGVIVSVSDTGEGISAENIDKVFEPFFTTRPVGKGTGLGLSVSFGIVSDHGGTIEVESSPGQGTCFTLWLPIEVKDG